MTEQRFIKKDRILVLLGWCVLPAVYLSWCLFTISYTGIVYTYCALGVGIVAAFIFCVCAKNYCAMYPQKCGEISSISISGIILIILVLLVSNSEFLKQDLVIVRSLLVLWLVSCGTVLFFSMKNRRIGTYIERIREHAWLCLLLILSVILVITGESYQLKWDGLLYYDSVKNASLGSVSSVSLYGHIAFTAGAFYRLFFSLFYEGREGMQWANIILMLFAVCSFYKIIRLVFPGKKKLEYVIAAAPFAVSPFLAGMAGYFSTDWFCVCIVIILLEQIIAKKWLTTTISAGLFCWSKEPALIAYAGICFGMVAYDFVNTEGKLSDRVVKLFRTVHYYYMLIPYLIWIITYRILGKWSAGNGGFEINIDYIVEKLKVFLLLNFNWIWTGLFVILFVCIIRRKCTSDSTSWIVYAISGNAFVLAFNLIFVTVNHPRYIDSFVSVNILLGTSALFLICKKDAVRNLIFVVLAVLGIGSCIATIDPLSRAAFESTNVGDSVLLSTGNNAFGDAAIYNMQMGWIEKPISDAFYDSFKENLPVVIPVMNDSVYCFDGMSEQIGLEHCKDVWLADTERKQRIAYNDERVQSDCVREAEVYYISADNGAVELAGVERFSVVYIQGVNDIIVPSEYTIESTQEYMYRGLVVCRDKVVRK